MTKEQEQLILTILQEECAELIMAIAKIKRFGLDSTNPVTGQTNREIFEQEISDVGAMLSVVIKEFHISDLQDALRQIEKKDKIQKYHPVLEDLFL